MRRRSLTAALAAVPLFLSATAGAAMADQIYNKLDGSIDATAEILPLNANSAATSVQLYVNPTGEDGKSGCNITGSTTLVVAVGSSDPTVATVSPSSLTFGSCGDVKSVSVTPVAVGSTTVTLTKTSSSTAGTFDLAPATFTVNVTAPAPANTAPTVEVTGVTEGATYDVGDVPSATCDVADAEDGPSSFEATLGDITGPYFRDGIGSQTATCDHTDSGGLEAVSSVTYNIVDPSAPVVTYTLDPASPDGKNDWYTSDVTLTWHVSDPDSPNSLTKTGCVDQGIIADQDVTTYTCVATSAGGSTGPVTASIKRDGTAPTVEYDGVTDGTSGADGWYTSDVAVQFTATDALSGPASQSQTVTSSGEGVDVVVDSPQFSDGAGNTTPAGTASRSFKIDTTAPTGIAFGPVDGAEVTGGDTYYWGSVPKVPTTCSAVDDVSGASCVVTGADNPGTVGAHIVTATATNGAGLSDSKTLEYTVMAWTLKGFYAPVDMSGVLNTVKGGSTVPLKFEVFSDHELTDTSVVASFKQQQVTCPGASAITDAIEVTSTGGTNLRYDSTSGQFIQNWQTPKIAGACYVVTMTTQDGSKLQANFKLK